MTTNINITDFDNINTILDTLHDQWFDAEKIALDRTTKILKIPFYDKSNPQEAEAAILWLVIKHVESYAIEDSEKVGLYDLNEIKYNPTQKSISLTTGIPFGFTVQVDQFELILETEG